MSFRRDGLGLGVAMAAGFIPAAARPALGLQAWPGEAISKIQTAGKRAAAREAPGDESEPTGSLLWSFRGDGLGLGVAMAAGFIPAATQPALGLQAWPGVAISKIQTAGKRAAAREAPGDEREPTGSL